MALNFPSSPTIGQVYTDTISGFSYEWDGTVWRSFSPSSSSQIRALDDISGSFDNTETTFPLTSNGTPITPPSPQSLIINLGGVIQDPTSDYSVSGANITFSTPPTSDLSFSGVSLGPAVPITVATIPDGTVTDGALRISTNAVVGSATTFTEDLVVEGDARVTGILTVGTSSLTLNGNTNTINGVTISSGSITTENIQASSINSGPLAGMRNAIINGNFDIWQRGTSFTGTEYTADRWLSYRSGSTHTVSRQPFTLGQTDVPGEPEYYARTVVSSVAGADNFSAYQQRIEDVRTFASQQITVSFWAKADANKNIAVEFMQNFGSGGSPSGTVQEISPVKKALTTSWQKITHTVTVPSISGKTLGSDNNSFLRLNIWFDAGSNLNSNSDTLGQQSGTFDIAQVQLEPGPVATPFERRPIGTELALCQRYFEKSFNLETAPVQNVGSLQGALTTSGVSTSNNALLGHVDFAAEKRAVPTVTTFNTFSAGSGWSQSGALDRSASIYSVGTRALNIRVDTASSSAAANMSIHWAVSAEL
jgi:hypothetical protein